MSIQGKKKLNNSQYSKKRNSYDGTFKAKVVLELLNGKSTLQDLALKYQLHPNQIMNWKATLFKHASSILDDKRRRCSD